MKNKNEKKEYVVFGLGRFGSSVAKQLEANGCTVLAVDNNAKKINAISDYVTHSACLDITNEEAMSELGLSNFDGCVVSIGHNLEAAIFAVIAAKEHGIKKVICKAYDQMQGKILTKVGADEIIYPEREMGRHLANNLAFENMLDTVELTSDYSIADVPVLKEWVGKSLADIRLRDRYHVSAIALKHDRELEISPSATKKFIDGDILVLLGTNETLKKFANKL